MTGGLEHLREVKRRELGLFFSLGKRWVRGELIHVYKYPKGVSEHG